MQDRFNDSKYSQMDVSTKNIIASNLLLDSHISIVNVKFAFMQQREELSPGNKKAWKVLDLLSILIMVSLAGLQCF